LGYVLEARRSVELRQGDDGIEDALDVLDQGRARGVSYGARALSFQLRMLYRHSKLRYEFAEISALFRLLAGQHHTMTMVELFREAVAAYQVGEYERGRDLFKKLRQRARDSGNAPLRMKDFWRDDTDPNHYRSATVRVDKIMSEWRGEGYVHDLRQWVPIRPRHFTNTPKLNEVVSCAIQFETNGPLAVPPRFVERRSQLH
jgi:hypothetical protein